MGKHYVVVSTYPETGSKNVGDQLITDSLIGALRQEKGTDIEFSIVWREALWDDVSAAFEKADFVFFACLAIRPRMHEREYPYLEKVLDSGVPYAVVSAGTDLDVTGEAVDIFDGFSSESLLLLRRMDREAVFFTTRGYVTQSFCRRAGLENALFSGDIAFFNPPFYHHEFAALKDIRRILISDPHKPKLYMESLRSLLLEIRRVFPVAEIVLVQHGVSKAVEIFAQEYGVKLFKAYEDKHGGLNVYAGADMHVGFRVHAHVSALSRRVYSYLVEQDGRGCDYGLTIERKISVPGYSSVCYGVDFKVGALGKRYRFFKRKAVSKLAPSLLVSMIENDRDHGFLKFAGLEVQLRGFVDSLMCFFKKVP